MCTKFSTLRVCDDRKKKLLSLGIRSHPLVALVWELFNNLYWYTL